MFNSIRLTNQIIQKWKKFKENQTNSIDKEMIYISLDTLLNSNFYK